MADCWEALDLRATMTDAAAWACYTAVWNVTGHPADSVPAGLSRDGLPLAVQLVARNETTLLSLAGELEAARPWDGTRAGRGRA
jgi:amidase